MSFFATAVLVLFLQNLFGSGIEKPPYEVVQQLSENIEIRKYSPTKWVGTSVRSNVDKMESQYQGEMFGRLFQYISGQNDAKQKIPMTAPVMMSYKSDQGEINHNTDCNISMSFYVPKDHQDNTPNPTGGQDMFVKSEPEMTVAVAKFGGYATPDDYFKYRDEIIAALGSEAPNYDTVNFIYAGYDPPFKPIKRTNEIWLRKMN